MAMRLTAVIALMLLTAFVGCQSIEPVKNNTVKQSISVPKATTAKIARIGFANPILRTKLESDQTRPTQLPAPKIENTSLSLAQLEQLAFTHNPTLVAASARFEAALGRQVQAGLCPNPVMGYHATEVGNLGTAGAQGGFVAQKIITAGKLHLDQAIAGKNAEAAEFRLLAQEQRVLTDVRTRYYETLVAQRRVELTRQLMDIGTNLVKATEQLLKGRLGTDNDVLQAEIRSDQARILYETARNDLSEAWQRMAVTLGVADLPLTRLDGPLDASFSELTWDQCKQRILVNHPELKEALARVEQNQIAIARARKEPIPNVDVFLSFRHQNITDSDIANVQVGIPIPIFDQNQGNIRAAEADWTASQAEVHRIELDLQDRLAKAFRRYANARQQVYRYRQRIVPKAKKSLDLVTVGYREGQAEYLTLLTAQETYVNVNLAYLDALREYWTAYSVIEGQLLTDSLANRP